MAKNESRRLKPSILLADENGFAALQTIPHYAPVNPTFSVYLVTAVRRDMANLRGEEREAEKAYATARNAAVAKEWEFHNLMLGVKTQVIAQFGVDSDELALLGRKKKSDYKPPGRRSTKK